MSSFKLSPSDFAFFWEECRRCYYLSVVSKFPRPRTVMPKIFTLIDARMNARLDGMRSEQIASGIPPGVIMYGQRWVESTPIEVPGTTATCYIRGRFDTVVAFDDGTYGVIDLKTSQAKAEHIPLYSRQLHAYTWALEHPAPGKFSLRPVSTLGLLVFEPGDFLAGPDRAASLSGGLHWIEAPRDDRAFLDFLGEVVRVLEQPSPPASDPDCDWCRYREQGRQTGL